jgi:hypothetical protein
VSGRVPSWLFADQVHVGRWHARGAACLLLLTDDYPVFEGEHPITYELAGPSVVARRKVIVWKFITAIPHLVVLFVLTVARWYSRLAVYLQSLTDEFPAFSLRSTAGRSSQRMNHA